MYPNIQQVIEKITFDAIAPERLDKLQVLIEYLQQKQDGEQPINLNFICTHNSRRSQFSQVWAQVAAAYYGIAIGGFSGGVEVTAFNPRAIQSLQRFGFKVDDDGGENPRYHIQFAYDAPSILVFSKLFDDAVNPTSGFAAVMTCSHADENCPYVPGCDVRISLPYNDPKEFDDTPLESAMYDYRSFQIATELMYVFSKIK